MFTPTPMVLETSYTVIDCALGKNVLTTSWMIAFVV